MSSYGAKSSICIHFFDFKLNFTHFGHPTDLISLPAFIHAHDVMLKDLRFSLKRRGLGSKGEKWGEFVAQVYQISPVIMPQKTRAITEAFSQPVSSKPILLGSIALWYPPFLQMKRINVLVGG